MDFQFFPILRVLLLAACLLLACLLAAKPGRSTLDTKRGYKTKTGSTSSVTRTLPVTRCWNSPTAERCIDFLMMNFLHLSQSDVFPFFATLPVEMLRQRQGSLAQTSCF